MSTTDYQTRPTATTGMPGGIPYIIGNEAAERFSFYGMKSILTVFMVDYLHLMGQTYESQGMSDAAATEHYHTFTAAVYFFPILGALIADVLFGKYRTILWLSIVYCLGHGALALMGMPAIEASTWLVIGLLLISVGSGGIKPCVSAHVGDQFGKSNQSLLTKVYQWFYFSINFGSFISTLLTPWLLEHYGPHWAFGIPGVLMAIATFLFWFGRHKFIHVPAGGTRFLKETFSAEGLSALAKLIVVFAFVAVFWALFDQTGSSWVLQAKNLNREWLGFTWLESQIQAVNPILVLILIPIFQFVIYPAINRFFPLTHIRKISIGLFVMIGGFAIVALLQQRIDAGEQPSIGWQFLAYGVLTASEIMVSITCLEFAYTQSPKTMKSVVMAVFLISVSLGNVFTAAVNSYIQTPSVNAILEDHDRENFATGDELRHEEIVGVYREEARSSSAATPEAATVAGAASPGRKEVESQAGELQEKPPAGPARWVAVAGHDGQFDSDDDVRLYLNEEGTLDRVATESDAAFEAAASKIEAAILNQSGGNREMISRERGQALIAGATDTFGNSIRYHLISRDEFRLTSAGADGEPMTRWDLVLESKIKRAEGAEERPAQAAPNAPYFSWRDRRIIELKGGDDPEKRAQARVEILDGRAKKTSTEFDHEISVGGLVRLQGAAYFWFWTIAIAVTAVLFIPVGLFYRGKTYIQDEQDWQDAAEETTITPEASAEAGGA